MVDKGDIKMNYQPSINILGMKCNQPKFFVTLPLIRATGRPFVYAEIISFGKFSSVICYRL